MPFKKICEVCGSEFYMKPSRFNTRHTCSNECRFKRHSEVMKGHLHFGGAAPKGHPAWGGFKTRYPKGQLPWNTGLNRSGMSGKKTSEETKRKIWIANNKPEYIAKRLKALHVRPTRPEKKIIDLIGQYKLPLKYTGDGGAVVGSFVPDFLNEDEKKIVEVFGRVFHDPERSFHTVSWNRTEIGRTAEYKKLGYDCLILWDDELETDNLFDNINSFLEAAPT